MDDFDLLMRDADPARQLADNADDDARAAITKIVSGDAIPARRHPSRRVLLPTLVVAGLALTAGAIVAPLWMAVNDTSVTPDVRIPIEYTTDSGKHVRCEYAIYFGDPEDRRPHDEQQAAQARAIDWSGIGQEIYHLAMRHPFSPGGNDEGWASASQEELDARSFSDAVDLVWSKIPSSGVEGASGGGVTDCAGILR